MSEHRKENKAERRTNLFIYKLIIIPIIFAFLFFILAISSSINNSIKTNQDPTVKTELNIKK